MCPLHPKKPGCAHTKHPWEQVASPGFPQTSHTATLHDHHPQVIADAHIHNSTLITCREGVGCGGWTRRRRASALSNPSVVTPTPAASGTESTLNPTILVDISASEVLITPSKVASKLLDSGWQEHQNAIKLHDLVPRPVYGRTRMILFQDT
ncbi:unnamed protein product [Leptosia nina]|uniref:Uncharacterized protein n=1 Tax=Leptosia nina TaxID=320188 RepID=A0AAV1J670_9NEOP